MNDQYGYAYIPEIEVEDVSIEGIAMAIEDNYTLWCNKLSHIGTGTVRVWGKNMEANGVIIWLWTGKHKVYINTLELKQAA